MEGMTHLLKLRTKFTALICGNDEMAAGAMAAASDNGLSVPDDISIVGFDNSAFCNYLSPKLSTINYPVKEMSEMAAHWVLKNVYRDQKFHIENILAAEVVERDSVRQL
jgi:LacI family transcriptional regulator